jgi:hypothetical protein
LGNVGRSGELDVGRRVIKTKKNAVEKIVELRKAKNKHE